MLQPFKTTWLYNVNVISICAVKMSLLFIWTSAWMFLGVGFNSQMSWSCFVVKWCFDWLQNTWTHGLAPCSAQKHSLNLNNQHLQETLYGWGGPPVSPKHLYFCQVFTNWLYIWPMRIPREWLNKRSFVFRDISDPFSRPDFDQLEVSDVGENITNRSGINFCTRHRSA